MRNFFETVASVIINIEVWGAESAGYNACGGVDGAGAVQERCRGGARGAGAVQAACTICTATATSIISGAGRCRGCRHTSEFISNEPHHNFELGVNNAANSSIRGSLLAAMNCPNITSNCPPVGPAIVPDPQASRTSCSGKD